ncbi:MAG TPA: sigma-70 family RNA polymerase sigma factor [Verrucomicrobiae bacterium]|nr:sigma-70 family RNA polymerase sigma factor [Verrucomicrobiae bacterium]
MSEPSDEVSSLLIELKRGNKEALGRLMPLVYEELRRLAGHYLRLERPNHTLQPTALVHEAYLRLVGQDRADWQNRGQFMAVAAKIMRRILVDYARGRATGKRDAARMDIVGLELNADGARAEEILAVDEALSRLAEVDPQQARVVELRYFAGMTVEETAQETGHSERTVKREWSMAAAWLRSELGGRKLL